MAGKTKAPRKKALGRSPLAADTDLPLAPVPVKVERPPMKITFDMMLRAQERPSYNAPRIDGADLFRPYEPAPGVLPEGQTAQMAFDDAGGFGAMNWAGQGAGGYIASAAYKEGQTFLGYSELALMAQRPEYRIMCETLADEATRKWIKLKAKSEDDDKAAKIKAIEDEFMRLGVREHFRIAAEKDGHFGRHHIYLDTGDTDNAEELKTNLGDSRSTVSKSKVSPERPLRALRSIEAMWCYPGIFNANKPLKKDFYRPEIWYAMGTQIHVSRLLCFVAREVPDILKAAYSFGGLALTQMAKPYVDNWLITRQSVQDLIKGFSTYVLKTDMQAAYSGVGGNSLFDRADMFNMMRNNRGLMLLDKENEDFANVSAPLSGLDHLQAQSLEHICSVIQEPLVKYTGISPSGLNASSEGELLCWKDKVHSYQEAFFRPHLETILNFVQLSLWGEIDEGIIFEFVPIHELTEKEQAELDQLKAQTDALMIEAGQIDAHEARQRVANDETSPYAGLDVDDMPEMPGAEGMEGGEGSAETAEAEAPAIEGAGEEEAATEQAPAVESAPVAQPQPGSPIAHKGSSPIAHKGKSSIAPKKSLGLGGIGNAASEGGFKPAGDVALDGGYPEIPDNSEKPDNAKPKRGKRKTIADECI